MSATYERDGQRYVRLDATKEHTTRDGRVVTLWAWSTSCADCGCDVVVWSFETMTGDGWKLKRRCDPCAETARKAHRAKITKAGKAARKKAKP